MNKVAAIVFASFAFVLVACTGSDDDNAASTASALTVVDACAAEVTCDFDDGPASTQLTKDADGCHMGGLTLVASGTIVGKDLSGAVWKSTTTTVSLCDDRAPQSCIECHAASAAATTTGAAPAAKCTGIAFACSSRVAGTCSRQDGCSMAQHTHVGLNNTLELEYECEGDATSCDEYASKSLCEGQSGCEWK